MRSLRFLVRSLLLVSLAVLLPSAGRAFTLDFQLSQNADLEQGAAPGGNDLGTTTKTRTGIATPDGATIDFTVVSAPGNLNSADVGIGVMGGTSDRMGTGESVTFTFSRKVVLNGYTLNMFNGTDNSTWQTTTSGAAQTSTSASVTGLNAVIEPGEALTFSSTAGDGIRLGTLVLTVPVLLDFQLAKNADLESGSGPGATDLGVTTRTRSGIPAGDGSFISYTAVSAPGTLNSADNGIGVTGGTGVARLGIGESVTFSFNRPVTVHGYTLNELGGTDNSTWLSPTSGGTQTATTAVVKGLSLPLQTGETLTISSTAGDGVRIATLTLTVPPLPVTPDDRYQVLHDSTANSLDLLRNDGSGVALVSLTQPSHGTASISGSNVLYTPAPGYTGQDTFTYTTNAASGGNTWTVTVSVRAYPNFVMVLADDQGWTGTSVPMDRNRSDTKSDYYKTPNIETFAAQGMRFPRGYSAHPNCSPSRYALLTGKTLARLKMTDIVGRSNAQVSGQYKLITPGKATDAIQATMTTTPELLKSIAGAGYSAAHFGKWHLNGGGPASHGFDADANDGATGNGEGDTGTEPINSDAKRSYSITDRALAYLDSRVGGGTPFYLQVSHYAVHEAIQCTQASYDAFAGVTPGVRHNNRYYAAMTRDLDLNVGRVLARLDELGIRNSTYIIYQADNGAPQNMSDNTPLRGYKPELWEGGIRVPTFVRGPGVKADSQCDQPVSGIDWLPTIWEWATGSQVGLPAQVDGGSVVATIRDASLATPVSTPIHRDGAMIVHSPHYIGPMPWPNDWQDTPKDMRPRSAIIAGGYKLVANYEKGSLELYDLANEAGEITNLSESQRAVRWQLWVRLRDYLKQVSAQMPTLDPSYPGTSQGDFVLPAATGPLGDADSDGLDDAWEFRELLTYTFDGNDDEDQDGVSNAAELAQGTDPLIPNALAITSLSQPSANQLKLVWNATPGASFVVESSTNLVDWSPVQNVTAGEGHSAEYIATVGPDHEFFRVRRL
ncbi:sulfatase-like hydrolase/transferase [Luteolibacter soli]|uniref:Sulfatase-like hydrolase/transferase n=1 Tax=Luteolibacter soli TaxID=3135280 RepID=A0ABU9AQN9_9BACT